MKSLTGIIVERKDPRQEGHYSFIKITRYVKLQSRNANCSFNAEPGGFLIPLEYVLTLLAEPSADPASPLSASPHRALQLLAQGGPLQLPAHKRQPESAPICKSLR